MRPARGRLVCPERTDNVNLHRLTSAFQDAIRAAAVIVTDLSPSRTSKLGLQRLAAIGVGRVTLAVLSLLALIALSGCEGLVPRDRSSLLFHEFRRSEIFGFVAGFGTTFAAVPDLIAMLRRGSHLGTNPRMTIILGAFQVPVGLLRFVDCLATRDRMEPDCGVDQFSECRRLFLLCPKRKKPATRHKG